MSLRFAPTQSALALSCGFACISGVRGALKSETVSDLDSCAPSPSTRASAAAKHSAMPSCQSCWWRSTLSCSTPSAPSARASTRFAARPLRATPRSWRLRCNLYDGRALQIPFTAATPQRGLHLHAPTLPTPAPIPARAMCWREASGGAAGVSESRHSSSIS
jgi:hypothetical protein